MSAAYGTLSSGVERLDDTVADLIVDATTPGGRGQVTCIVSPFLTTVDDHRRACVDFYQGGPVMAKKRALSREAAARSGPRSASGWPRTAMRSSCMPIGIANRRAGGREDHGRTAGRPRWRHSILSMVLPRDRRCRPCSPTGRSKWSSIMQVSMTMRRWRG